ncbi:hypothetical protein [Mycolicibacterium fluoranthenivorans]|uniref:DUF4149 domain-containing protein n=1 Tax=Mycolicibacterium fluoranthenivorans TaxID=258505 RepID=A0A1G4WR15_9MYCO|nr:hypothetical protein [Mycolicibacterium fluoranthenivorans]SCX27252.1 hypothetical protein SAMN02799620_04259 [Mycolicibacterium fluoranthenivorans]
MSGGVATAVAGVFVWLGMVLAISFVEAPLKFRAPGVTLAIGLGIGRLVFRALNAAESVLGLVVIAALALSHPPVAAVVATATAAGALVVQLIAVRPPLTRRSDAVLAGAEVPRSRAHHAYVGLEVIKVLGLIVAGVALLSR